MADDFSLCLVSNTRMAARAITRRYDAYLRPLGISATQFTLLSAIHQSGGHTVSDLAQERGFDRTTLTRNLDRLEAAGLLVSRAASRGNGRIAAVTARGEAILARALPLWRAAQADMRAVLGAEAFESAVGMLKRLAAA
jgi:DNA-binding MarR family transcriptional regulator